MGTRLAFAIMIPALLYAGSPKIVEITIINREQGESRYSYVVPGSSQTRTSADVNCTGTETAANCSGTATSHTSSVPAQAYSYDVTGATLTLQLPDGRQAVVNCESKLNLTDWSHTNQQRRSCRIPQVNNIQAEFDGDKAKLIWSVSVDGKKTQSETYKILAVIEKP
jgi:hypothetical protein